MSCGNHEISDYIFDLPMRISNSYMPKHFHIEIPEILSINEDENTYDFKIEREAITMSEIAEEDKCKETERLFHSGTLRDFSRLKSFDDAQTIDQTSNVSPILPGSPCLPILPVVPINGIAVSSLPSQPLANVISTPVIQPSPPPASQPQPPPVSVTLSTPLPVQLSLPIHGSIVGHLSYPITSITNVTPSVINCSNANINNAVNSISHGSSVGTASSSATSIPVNSGFTIDHDKMHNTKVVDPNNMKCNNDVNNVIARRNSVPTSLSTFQDNLGILHPVPSQFKCDSSKSNYKFKQQEFIPKTRINPADFESSSSSPFDDALLRAIDDKQELNHVFQHY